MNHDGRRAKCIEAMADDYIAEFRRIWPGSRPARTEAVRLMTAAFDSLHDVAHVIPIKATEEMIDHVAKAIEDAQDADMEFKYDRPAEALARYAIAAMSAAGNITNPPEKKL